MNCQIGSGLVPGHENPLKEKKQNKKLPSTALSFDNYYSKNPISIWNHMAAYFRLFYQLFYLL